MSLQSRISLAARHIEIAHKLILRQREIVTSGVAGLAAKEFLDLLQSTLYLFEDNLAKLTDEAERRTPGRPSLSRDVYLERKDRLGTYT